MTILIVLNSLYVKTIIKYMPKVIKAKKSLGQNFLIDEEALSTIAHSLDIADRHIIEV